MKLRISKKNSENTPEEKTRGTVFRKSAAAVLVSGALMCAVFFGASQIGSLYPYAITIDDDPVCYVATKSDGDRVIKNFVKDLAVDETEVKAIDSDNRLQVVRADEMKVDSDKILSVDEACKKLSEEDALNEGKDGKDPLTLKVVSSRVDDIAFTPEPVYEANDTMLAGSEEVRSEGRNGRRRISTVYETQNGTIYGVTEKVLKVLDEVGTQSVPVVGGEERHVVEVHPLGRLQEDAHQSLGFCHIGCERTGIFLPFGGADGDALPRDDIVVGVHQFHADSSRTCSCVVQACIDGEVVAKAFLKAHAKETSVLQSGAFLDVA